MDIGDVVTVVDTEAAAALCLSHGGWEGWLQCELWRRLTAVKNLSAEREVYYPDSDQRCDLVVAANGSPASWVEIKAFGAFRQRDIPRFLDGVCLDVMKLDGKPDGDVGIALCVVPSAVGNDVLAALERRRLTGFQRTDSKYASIYHLEV